jgi:hypothetical protein
VSKSLVAIGLCVAMIVSALNVPAQTTVAANQTQVVEVKASDTAELNALLEKQRVDIRFNDGTSLSGQVRTVENAMMLMKVERSAGPSALTKGDHSIALSGLATIKITKYRGARRVVLATALGFAGLGLGLLITSSEFAGESFNSTYGGITAATTVAGVAAGYAWGRSLDKQEVTVIIR